MNKLISQIGGLSDLYKTILGWQNQGLKREKEMLMYLEDVASNAPDQHNELPDSIRERKNTINGYENNITLTSNKIAALKQWKEDEYA